MLYLNVILSVSLENQESIEYLFFELDPLAFSYEGKNLCPMV